jgi:hypothetical protein
MTSDILFHWASYFRSYFGHYAFLATMPLRNACLSTGWTITALNDNLPAGYPDLPNKPLSDLLQTVPFDDSDYFTFHEYRFLAEIMGYASSIGEADPPADEAKLRADMEERRTLPRREAEIVLKAIEFYKLRYAEKFAQWLQETRNITWSMWAKDPHNLETYNDEGYSTDLFDPFDDDEDFDEWAFGADGLGVGEPFDAQYADEWEAGGWVYSDPESRDSSYDSDLAYGPDLGWDSGLGVDWESDTESEVRWAKWLWSQEVQAED